MNELDLMKKNLVGNLDDWMANMDKESISGTPDFDTLATKLNKVIDDLNDWMDADRVPIRGPDGAVSKVVVRRKKK
jgi:hypothetical protein